MSSPVRRRAQPLVVGAAHDPAEHEADAVAAAVVQRLAEQDADSPAPARPHPVPSGRVHRSADAQHQHDAFEAAPEIDQRIRRATGSGQPLEADVRRRFEGATGRDLSRVRVHRTDEADQLNRAVSARAFTTGNDIFFSKGSYQPGSRQGQHLLAHELAHTAQSTSGVQRTIRRFALDRPDFSATTNVDIFQRGGSGNVAQFDDGTGKPLIVKVHQLIGNEVSVAGSLHAATSKKNGSSKGYSVKTPGVRLATDAEKAAIKQATLANLDPNTNPRNFVANLDSDLPVVLMLKGAGEDFKDALQNGQHLTTADDGTTSLDPKSIIHKMLCTPGPLTALAKQAPVDVLMGMSDRFLGLWNPENFMYDEATQSFGFVDNTQNRDEGFLTDIEGLSTGRNAFDMWVQHEYVTQIVSDRATIAGTMQETIESGIARTAPKQPGLSAAIRAAARDNRAAMKRWIEAGMAKGLTSLMATLKNPLKHVAGIPDHDKKLQALTNLIARRNVLKGHAPDVAWTKAEAEALKLLPAPKVPKAPKVQAPQRPTTNAPTIKPGRGGTQGGQPSRTWKTGHRWKSGVAPTG